MALRFLWVSFMDNGFLTKERRCFNVLASVVLEPNKWSFVRSTQTDSAKSTGSLAVRPVPSPQKKIMDQSVVVALKKK